jgi:argininosuccinate lyase
MEDLNIGIAYCAGRDTRSRPMADAALLPFDLKTNRAHCAMLCQRGIISPAKLRAIERGLSRIERQARKGGFELDASLEDVHINVERAVAGISGDAAAGVMHTARSRNDQTATDIRLWIREALLDSMEGVARAVRALAGFASTHRTTVMGGWTHGQPAMPTTLGHWAASHAAALTRDLQALEALWPRINECPLGAAAGFGSSWPIDRKLTARLLGFDRPQRNSLDVVSTRWEAEARLGAVLSVLMVHLSSLGQDLIFLSSPPRRLVYLDAAFTTGSSIMPQKRNPDFAEVTRARAATVQSLMNAAMSVGRGALSGYNRDSQWSKYWIMDLLEEVGGAPDLFARVIATLRVNREALERTASEEFVSAVDLADAVASSRGVEFRRLYHVVGEAVMRDLDAGRFDLGTVNALLKEAGIQPPMTADEFRTVADPRKAVMNRRSLGGPAPEDVAAQSRELKNHAAAAERWVRRRRALLAAADRKLRELTDRLIASA